MANIDTGLEHSDEVRDVSLMLDVMTGATITNFVVLDDYTLTVAMMDKNGRPMLLKIHTDAESEIEFEIKRLKQ